jgi:tetratricopeptide (TPR) repeat protein
MIDLAGRSVVFLGRLGRLPRRIAARCVTDRGGIPRRCLTRATHYAVVGRDASAWLAGNRLNAKLATARRVGAICLGEGDFLRGLALLPPLPKEGRTLTLDDLANAGGLDRDTLQLLVLLDILECEDGRFSFSSLSIVRTASRLMSEGAPLVTVCQSLLAHGHRQTAAALVRRPDGTIGMRWGHQVADLSGQLRLLLPEPESPSVDDLFEAAELAEEASDFAQAERLYRRCVDLDRTDPAAAFNLANLLRAQGRHGEAKVFFRLATEIEPGFAEGWYNLAHLLDLSGSTHEAEKAYGRALEADPNYADALFNAAMLHFRQDRYHEAATLWERYLAVDPKGEWARRARSGLAYCRRAVRFDTPIG